jgi:thioredoxin reductase
MSDVTSYDVAVVGGGPAGLSAALLLGRCRFRVVVVDAGRPRNRAAQEIHGYLGRDGTPPGELLRAGRRELRRYGVELRDGEVTAAARRGRGFALTLAGGRRLRCRRLLVATGVEDPLPDVPGLAELYGTSVFHCPFCDGWEVRDQPLALYGRGGGAARFALKLTRWSADLVLLTDGPARLRAADRAALAAAGVTVRTMRIAALEAAGGKLARVRFKGGDGLPRAALFFASRPRQTCELLAKLGVRFTAHGMVRADRKQDTGVPGLYVAGDAGRDVQLAVVAAAEGVKAAVAIHGDLDAERIAAARKGTRAGAKAKVGAAARAARQVLAAAAADARAAARAQDGGA